MNGHGPYQVELYYACQECESGIYHAFEAVDPAANMDGDKMAASFLKTSGFPASLCSSNCLRRLSR